MGKIKINPGWDQLTQDACEATNEGITYGQLMGRKYEAEEKERMSREEARRKRREARREMPGFCRNCGQAIARSNGRTVFCCWGCEEEYREKKAQENTDPRGAWAPAKPKRTCQRCGKQLADGRWTYCSEECSKAAKAEGISLQKARERANRPIRMCAHCGHVITDEKRRKYCSNKCMKEAGR